MKFRRKLRGRGFQDGHQVSQYHSRRDCHECRPGAERHLGPYSRSDTTYSQVRGWAGTPTCTLLLYDFITGAEFPPTGVGEFWGPPGCVRHAPPKVLSRAVVITPPLPYKRYAVSRVQRGHSSKVRRHSGSQQLERQTMAAREGRDFILMYVAGTGGAVFL